MWLSEDGNVPVERDSNIARINRSENKTQVRHQCPGEEYPHAIFRAEKVFNTTTSSDGRDSGDDTGDETANEDACDIRSCGHWDAEDAVEEG